MTEEVRHPFFYWKQQARRFVSSLVNVVFPATCAYCRKVGSLFCDDCRRLLQWVKEPVCTCCGRTTLPAEKLCASCTKRPLPLKQIRASVLFADPAARVIHKMKYEGAFGLAAPLADLMIAGWSDWAVPVDLIVPIPLHPDRQKKRGYNQALLLAQRLSERFEWVLSPDLLARTKFTVPQVGLNATERLANVQDAFTINGKDMVEKDVLLIDDVCTTGATLAAAAQVLLAAGAASVSGYCVARAM